MVAVDVLEDLQKFLSKKMTTYSGQDVSGDDIHCFTGYLPRVQTAAIKEKLCPAVVVGYSGVIDQTDESIVSVVISVVTSDPDMLYGAYGLFHLLEYIRCSLLEANPVCDKYDVKNGTMETSVPDAQPYPQWWGRIDFEVHIPQPARTNPFLLGGPEHGRK